MSLCRSFAFFVDVFQCGPQCSEFCKQGLHYDEFCQSGLHCNGFRQCELHCNDLFKCGLHCNAFFNAGFTAMLFSNVDFKAMNFCQCGLHCSDFLPSLHSFAQACFTVDFFLLNWTCIDFFPIDLPQSFYQKKNLKSFTSFIRRVIYSDHLMSSNSTVPPTSNSCTSSTNDQLLSQYYTIYKNYLQPFETGHCQGSAVRANCVDGGQMSYIGHHHPPGHHHNQHHHHHHHHHHQRSQQQQYPRDDCCCTNDSSMSSSDGCSTNSSQQQFDCKVSNRTTVGPQSQPPPQPQPPVSTQLNDPLISNFTYPMHNSANNNNTGHNACFVQYSNNANNNSSDSSSDGVFANYATIGHF